MVIANTMPNVAIARLGDGLFASPVALSCNLLAINNSVSNLMLYFIFDINVMQR